MVLSIDIASGLVRPSWSFRMWSHTRLRTPFFDQRFIRVLRVCHRPNRSGKPRHVQPCSATYRIALSPCRFDTRTFPRYTGSNGAMRSY